MFYKTLCTQFHNQTHTQSLRQGDTMDAAEVSQVSRSRAQTFFRTAAFSAKRALSEGMMRMGQPFTKEARLILSARWLVRKANIAIEGGKLGEAAIFCGKAAAKLSLAGKNQSAAELYLCAADFSAKSGAKPEGVSSLLFLAAEEFSSAGDVRAINTYLSSSVRAPQDTGHRALCRKKARESAFALAGKSDDVKEALHLYEVALCQSDSCEEKREIAQIALPLANRFLAHCAMHKAGVSLAEHHVSSFQGILQS